MNKLKRKLLEVNMKLNVGLGSIEAQLSIYLHSTYTVYILYILKFSKTYCSQKCHFGAFYRVEYNLLVFYVTQMKQVVVGFDRLSNSLRSLNIAHGWSFTPCQEDNYVDDIIIICKQTSENEEDIISRDSSIQFTTKKER